MRTIRHLQSLKGDNAKTFQALVYTDVLFTKKLVLKTLVSTQILTCKYS